MEIKVGKLEVGIVVRDVDAVTPFYRDGLGLPTSSTSTRSSG
jgi:catechol-2,3-dioxygenase